MVFASASPTYPIAGVRTSPSEMFDSVYQPYVTPPTPFEKSTHNTDLPSNFNPYAQSMWWTTRGNAGEEINKYRRESSSKTKQKLKNYENLGETQQKLMAKNFTLWKLLYNCEDSGKLKDVGFEQTMKEATVEIGKAQQMNKRSLLPSLVANKESITSFDSKDSYYKDSESTIDLIYNTLSFDMEKLEVDIIQSYTYENTVENQLLRPLKARLPSECLQIQSKLIKKIKCLTEISCTFDKYVEDERILVNNKLKLYLFSNINTLMIIHSNFFEAMLSKTYIDTEEMVYDHLKRLYHVYPSYLASMKLRQHFIQIILRNQKFKGFIGDIDGEEFTKLILCPAIDFLKLLKFFESYIGIISPRIKSLIQNFMTCYNLPLEDKVKLTPNEPLYLEVPKKWRALNRTHWKEIHSMGTTSQIVYYLQSELKFQFQEYGKIIKLIKYQLENMSRLRVINKYACAQMKKLETLPGAVSNRKKYNIKTQNRQIYSLIDTFLQFINTSGFQECESLIKTVCQITEKIYTEKDNDYVSEKIFEVYFFKKMFEERVYHVFVRFVFFFRNFVGFMNKDGAEDVRDIVNSFRKKRGISIVEGLEKFMARKQIARRLGIRQYQTSTLINEP